MSKRIHLNNAGASLVSDKTLDVMISYLRLEQKIGGYEAATEFGEKIEQFYPEAAKLIGCKDEQIAYSDSATRAWNTLLFSLSLNQGDKIVTVSTEFGSNVVSLQSIAERADAELVVIPVCERGILDIEELSKHVDERLKLVALSHAPAHCGNVINAKEIGACLNGSDAFFLLDACQTIGQFDVFVDEIGCDALVATGRKWLRGPRGTGFIYVNDRMISSLRSVSVDLANADWLAQPKNGSQVSYFKKAQRLQTWERSLACQLGLSNAIAEYRTGNAEGKISSRIAHFRSIAENAVKSNPKLITYPDGNTDSGVVTFFCRELESEKIKAIYAKNNINVSLMSEWDAPWDFRQKKLPTLLRVSPHYINSESDLDAFCSVTKLI